MKLVVKEVAAGEEMQVMKISGFADEELIELKELNDRDYKRAGRKLLDILDERNDEIGTIWWRSDGVFAWWFDLGGAYVVIGR